jgi:hypothetical protein
MGHEAAPRRKSQGLRLHLRSLYKGCGCQEGAGYATLIKISQVMQTARRTRASVS